MNDGKPMDSLMRDLQERAKELNCLYMVEEVLNETRDDLDAMFSGLLHVIPDGWQFPELCQVKLEYQGKSWYTRDYEDTPWQQTVDIVVQEKPVGRITISYREEVPASQNGIFLKEETRLINSIAERIGHTVLHQELKEVYKEWRKAGDMINHRQDQWEVIVDLLQKTDKKLFIYLSHKMLHYLCWNGVESAKTLLQSFSGRGQLSDKELLEDENRPQAKQNLDNLYLIGRQVFHIAERNLDSDVILSHVQKWIQEDKSRFLVRAIDDPNSSLPEIIDSITRYRFMHSEGITLSPSIEKGLKVSLVRRFFSDQLEFINVAKEHIDVADYYDLIPHMIFPQGSHGKLGGKSAGLFLADRIVCKSPEFETLFPNLKVPKTWYITSDGLITFLYYNNLEEVIEQKYKNVDEITLEYPNIIQIFKNSHFPPEIIRGLSMALDDLGETPIIVRSSSLLEDRLGAAFSGKYKSLFLANRGSKAERLDALKDAIAEIYASTFSPDPIEYRTERGLLDFFEEMGIMIQEVVGHRVGDFFLPTFAGVAFSHNEFRWSARIEREDGLIRMVPGLGTRAVDRVSDDYPCLIAPGKPDLRVNVTPEEVQRYSPRYVDVINLKTNSFQTIEIQELLRLHGDDINGIHRVVSIKDGDMITPPTSMMNIDFENHELVANFEGLIQRTPFISRMRNLLNLLKQKIGCPVDVEFAHDGTHLYLLQCRPQSYSRDIQPSPIPKDIPIQDTIFTANRYISNGSIPDITHVVYVDPDEYNNLSSHQELKRVGTLVGRLNKLLPKRQFILMGPGRWGSRGDIKLGVSVTYSEINNTAALVEVAKKKGNYTPDLSFGTHFFQDLVEASIRYLPLYPDDPDVVFNERFFTAQPNILKEILPEFAPLEQVVRVIDIPSSNKGRILKILMNADLNRCVAMLADPGVMVSEVQQQEPSTATGGRQDEYWRWRLHMAEQIARKLDGERFGVRNFYLFGSTKNGTAGPGSDIDLLIHFDGSKKQREELMLWLDGWSRALGEINHLRTGYPAEGLLDIHLVTNKDIENRTSYAVKIGAVTDAARPLEMKKKEEEKGS
ncbi:MAG: nucleotidyltransferase domain-containing protein [Candidatus Aminicenantes bacterium]|nr:nucleotidyltransferase domain-containing protein [Candidatus Aminicenantes bacterium]